MQQPIEENGQSVGVKGIYLLRQAKEKFERTVNWLLNDDKPQADRIKKLEEENNDLRCELGVLKYNASFDSDGMMARFEQVKREKKKYMVKSLELEADLAFAQSKIDLQGQQHVSCAIKHNRIQNVEKEKLLEQNIA